MITCLLGSDIR